VATTLYFRNLSSTLGGAGDRAMSQRIGRPRATATATTTSGGTNIQITATAGGQVLTWYSEPLTEGVTISLLTNVSLWCRESANTVNAGIALQVDRTNNAGTVQSTMITRRVIGAEAGTTSAVRTASITPTSTTFSAGDRIKFTVSVINVGTMGAGTFDFDYNNFQQGLVGASFMTFNDDFRTDDIVELPMYEIRGLNGYKG
jgi:predicted acyl esterase